LHNAVTAQALVDRGGAVLFPACLESDEIFMTPLNLRGILDEQDAFVGEKEPSERLSIDFVPSNRERPLTILEVALSAAGSRRIAISRWRDGEAEDFVRALGADAFLEKASLAEELVPAIKRLVGPLLQKTRVDSYRIETEVPYDCHPTPVRSPLSLVRS